MEIKKSIEQGFGGGLYDTLTGMQNEAGALPVAGKTYYVSKYGNGVDGLTWETAFATLTTAITEANLEAARFPYKMNRMYVDGGNYDETLVSFPSHCEMIGVGAAPARIVGTSVMGTAANVCHIYNMQFRGAVGSTDNVDLGIASNGVWFIGCLFTHTGSITLDSYITLGHQCYSFKAIDCDFTGTSNLSATTAIVVGGTLQSNIQIVNCRISAITNGITFASGMTVMRGGLIKGNTFYRDDGSDSINTPMANGIVILNETGSNQGTMITENIISAATPLTRVSANQAVKNYSIIAGVTYLDGASQA